jgi:hypothetical protein
MVEKKMIPQNAKTTAFGHGSSLKTGFRSSPAPLMTSSSTIAPSESLSLVSQAALLYTRGEELLLQNSSASLAEGAPLIESAAQLGYLPAQVILFALYAFERSFYLILNFWQKKGPVWILS